MSWLETLWLADVLSSDKKTARKKINWFVGIFFCFDWCVCCISICVGSNRQR